jgi:hypothetical protein
VVLLAQSLKAPNRTGDTQRIGSGGLDALGHLTAEGYAIGQKKYIETVKAERRVVFEREYFSRVKDVPARPIFRVGLLYDETHKAFMDEKISPDCHERQGSHQPGRYALRHYGEEGLLPGYLLDLFGARAGYCRLP